MDFSSLSLSSARLSLRSFSSPDAQEAFVSSTPTLTRFMTWEPPPSLEAFAQISQRWLSEMTAGTDAFLVVRLEPTNEFLGIVALHKIDEPAPEVGIWIKVAKHKNGYGREAVASAMVFAAGHLGKSGVLYPVAEANSKNRHPAESLGGEIVGGDRLCKPGGSCLLVNSPAGSVLNPGAAFRPLICV